MQFDELSNRVIGLALEVHSQLGPGLLETVHEGCLAFELMQQGIPFVRQEPVDVRYKGVIIECGFRIDLLVDGQLLLDLKSIESLRPVHEAQLLTYMKLTGIKTGLLLNFNEARLKDGIKRRVL